MDKVSEPDSLVGVVIRANMFLKNCVTGGRKHYCAVYEHVHVYGVTKDYTESSTRVGVVVWWYT